MSQPTPYDQSHEFVVDEGANPNFPGSEIDIELNAVETTLDGILTNLALIQRDDGALKNEIVTVDSLDTTLAAALGDVDAIAEVEALIAAADADVVLTHADVVLTHADVVLTHADVVSTTADALATAADAVSTAADVISTAADRAQTGLDRIATAADAVSTAADALATAADAVSTGNDAIATAADAVSTAADAATATTQAGLAQAAATAAAGSLDSFDDRYLGPYASDPTLDNDGNALLTGALYWNTSTGLKIYDGAAWDAYSAIAGILSLVEDTTPQLGGDLDVNGHAITGLSSSDSPQFAGVNIGAATDTTITRTGAGDIAVEGNAIYRAGGTDVPVADGGTGQSTAAAAVGGLIDACTEDTAPDATADFIGTYDASGATGKKVSIANVASQVPSGPGVYPGRYWGGISTNTGGSATLVMAANTIYANCIHVPRPLTFTRIGIEVTVLSAGNARLGLFTCGTDGAPGTLLLDAGTVSTGTTGIKEITISQTLQPGYYWAVVVGDATPTIRGLGQNAFDIGILGVSAPATVDAAITKSFSYAALSGASPFGTPTFATSNPSMIWLRIV